MAKTDFKSVDDYIASKPRDVQRILERVRKAIRKAIPAAEEGISYQVPTFKLHGRPVLFFAGWKEHYSLYPAGDALVDAFKDALAPYEVSKGTIRFPLSEPVPDKLIERIAKFRADHAAKQNRVINKKGRRRETQLERVRRICASMPSVAEKLSHGTPTFFVQKDKGVFAMLAENHHEDGRVAVWLPARAGLQGALIADAPSTYFKPPYVGPSGWIGIILEEINDETLEIHIREAWEIAAPKKKPRRL